MKRVRLLILTGLILAALIAAVVPALAGGEPFYILNWSFEADQNGDNIPDKWNVKGDIFRLCDHKYDSYDDCMMVFEPSNSGAALWQILDEEGWHVVTEEATCAFSENIHGALNLDSERVYFGMIFNYTDADQITVYSIVAGGTYPFDLFEYYINAPVCEPFAYGELVQVKWGYLSLPGDGYLGVDAFDLD